MWNTKGKYKNLKYWLKVQYFSKTVTWYVESDSRFKKSLFCRLDKRKKSKYKHRLFVRPTQSTNNTTLSEEEQQRRVTWFHLLKQLIGSTAPDQHLRGHVAVEENCRQKRFQGVSIILSKSMKADWMLEPPLWLFLTTTEHWNHHEVRIHVWVHTDTK